MANSGVSRAGAPGNALKPIATPLKDIAKPWVYGFLASPPDCVSYMPDDTDAERMSNAKMLRAMGCRMTDGEALPEQCQFYPGDLSIRESGKLHSDRMEKYREAARAYWDSSVTRSRAFVPHDPSAPIPTYALPSALAVEALTVFMAHTVNKPLQVLLAQGGVLNREAFMNYRLTVASTKITTSEESQSIPAPAQSTMPEQTPEISLNDAQIQTIKSERN